MRIRKHPAKPAAFIKSVSGQSLTEYVLLLMVVAGMGKVLWSIMPRLLASASLPFQVNFARTYKYGRPDACGKSSDNDPSSWSGGQNGCSGSPQFHPRYTQGQGGSSYMFARGP